LPYKSHIDGQIEDWRFKMLEEMGIEKTFKDFGNSQSEQWDGVVGRV